MGDVVDERWVEELSAQIGARTRISYLTPPPPFGVIDPVSVIGEGVTWLRDARAFDGRRRTAWLQLRDDLDLSLRELGPELRAHVASVASPIAPALDLEKYTPVTKRHRAVAGLEELLATLDTGRAVVAAWHDLVAAYSDAAAPPELCDLREAQLAALAKLRGFEWIFTPGRLGRTIDGRGDLVEVLGDRVDRPNERVDDRPLSERVASCDAYFRKPPAEADAVVWVAISDVTIWRWVIERDRVRFYDGGWWSAVVKEGAGQLPDELGKLSQIELDSIFLGLLKRDPEEQPFVVVRVELGRCRVPAAIEEAKRVALGVMNAAGLRADEMTGIPFDGGVVFSEGKLIADRGGFSLDRDFALARAERINETALGQALQDLEPELIEALLAKDARLEAALTTVEWLKQTKGLTPSQQLGLSLRAIEQIFAEVDERHWRETVHEHLAYPWSLSRVSDALLDIGYRAITSLGDGAFRVPTDQERADFLEVSKYVMAGDRFFFRRAVERLPWLLERVAAQSRLSRELRTLQMRLADGPAAARWLSDLEQEFTRNLSRTHRLRNAIVHGYPLQLDVVAANSAFARSVSVHAVHELVDATVVGQDLATHMRARRDDYHQRRALLEAGTAPADAFAWTAGT